MLKYLRYYFVIRKRRFNDEIMTESIILHAQKMFAFQSQPYMQLKKKDKIFSACVV